MRRGCLAVVLLWAQVAEAEVFYRLPWPEGLSFMFAQVEDGRITTHFTKAMLHAVDIAMPAGVPVLAALPGSSRRSKPGKARGRRTNRCRTKATSSACATTTGRAATYAHLAARRTVVAVGERVQPGQLLGYSGASGEVVQPHLHFVVTRVEKNASGWPEEISVPVQFYVGLPPVTFRPRSAVTVTANYSGPTPPPRAPSDWQPLVPWRPRNLGPWDEGGAWALLVACFASGVAGAIRFWQFSRK